MNRTQFLYWIAPIGILGFNGRYIFGLICLYVGAGVGINARVAAHLAFGMMSSLVPQIIVGLLLVYAVSCRLKSVGVNKDWAWLIFGLVVFDSLRYYYLFGIGLSNGVSATLLYFSSTPIAVGAILMLALIPSTVLDQS
jgi:cytochrome c oxidase assembly factor CtaG